jgi:hypothetical protein
MVLKRKITEKGEVVLASVPQGKMVKCAVVGPDGSSPSADAGVTSWREVPIATWAGWKERSVLVATAQDLGL